MLDSGALHIEGRATDAVKERKERDEKLKREAKEAGNKSDQEVDKDYGKFRPPGSPQASAAGSLPAFSDTKALEASFDSIAAGVNKLVATLEAKARQLDRSIADTNSRLGDSLNT